MDNEQENSRKPIIVAVIAVVIGAAVLTGLFFVLKNFRQSEATGSSQESFQGPAELSTTVQAECQQSAEKIIKMSACSEKENEYFSHVNNCQSVYFAVGDTSADSEEGNYGDLALMIAKCFADHDKAVDKAKSVLAKTLELPEWDIYMGPISCGSKSTLEAYLESYTTGASFSCIKTENLNSLVEDFKNKKFSVIKTLIPPGRVAHQGYIETDVSCPETIASIEKTLEQLLTDNFQITEPRIESTDSHNDVFIEFTKQDSRLLNIQLRPSAEGCLQFESLLAPSQESGE